MPLYIGMFVLGISIMVAVSTLTKKTPVLNTQSNATLNETLIALSPSSGNYTVGEQVDMGVTLSSEESIGGADIYLSYDPQKIEIDEGSVLSGNLFQVALSKVEAKKGEMIVTVLSQNKSGEKNAILFSFKVKGKETGEANIQIGAGTKVIQALNLSSIKNVSRSASLTFK